MTNEEIDNIARDIVRKAKQDGKFLHSVWSPGTYWAMWEMATCGTWKGYGAKIYDRACAILEGRTQ